MGFVYWILKKFIQSITTLYFKTIHVIGVENIPKKGPVIICGNHANQFIDPMVIMSYCNRDISFTMAASSYKKPVVGQLARSVKVIPVKRPEDSKYKGQGTVTFTSPNQIKTTGGNFTEEGKKAGQGFSIMIGNNTVVVSKVLDDFTLEIKENKELYEEYKNKQEQYFVY